MTAKQIKNIEKEIRTLVAGRRLHDAFALIKNTAEGAMQWEITDEIKGVERNYAYMLSYLTDGADDPERDRLLDDIMASSEKTVDRLVHRLELADTPTLYYNTIRYAKRAGQTTSRAIAEYKDAARQATSIDNLFASAKSGAETRYAEALRRASDSLFTAVWTSFPLHADDAAALVGIIESADTPVVTAMQLTSALGLALTQAFDARALESLVDVYSFFADDDTRRAEDISAAALVGILVALFKYADRHFPAATAGRLKLLDDVAAWKTDLKTAFMEMVRTRDTERINRTINDKIIPEMLALRPEIEKKMRDPDFRPESLEDLQDNPEWDELLSKSGIGDKLRELTEMQMEGSDVFMSTFAHLKNYTFFNDVIGWFTPFDHTVPELEKIVHDNPDLADVCSTIEALPFLCDSDKYSMMLSVGLIPPGQREMMLTQVKAQRAQADEIRDEIVGITNKDHRRHAIRNYLRNLYRFLNLFRRKGEFYNIFDRGANMLVVPQLRAALLDIELLNLIGEFYFKRGYYADAIEAFTILESLGEFSATLYQKMGYASEKIGDIANAIRFYEQADLFDSTSRWTKMRLATVYRAKDRNDDAARILLGLLEVNPDDVDVVMMLGYTYVRIGNYHEALRRFRQAEFIDGETKSGGSRRTLRPIAWSLFMTGDFERAAKYYERIIVDNPSGEDYLNMGHTALARSMFKEAVNYYKLYILADGNTKESFFTALKNDFEHLDTAGINPNTISLIADAMLYDLYP